MHHSGGESLVGTATRFNRAVRDKRLQRPGRGRWVEYVFPDLQRRYVEANLRKVYRGVMPDEDVTARVVLKPGYDDYTNDLQQLLLMRVADVSGDMLDVVRTAGLVGLYVQDPETRGNTDITNGGQEPRRQKVGSMSLVKEARELTAKEKDEVRSERKLARNQALGLLGGMAVGALAGAASGSKKTTRERIGNYKFNRTTDSRPERALLGAYAGMLPGLAAGHFLTPKETREKATDLADKDRVLRTRINYGA